MRGHPSSFVALPVSRALADGTPWLAEATETLPPRVRALHPADVHLTLVFFGGISPERAMAGFEAVSRFSIAPMTVRLGAVLPMGPPEGWTALSAMVTEGDERLRSLMLEVSAGATDAAEVRRESRAPKPHVTLARLHEKATASQREAALAWARSLDLSAVTLTLDELALYSGRRHRAPGEAAYEVVRRRPLG